MRESSNLLTCKGSGGHDDFLLGRFVAVLGLILLVLFVIFFSGVFLGLLTILITFSFLTREDRGGRPLEVAVVGVDEGVVLLGQVWHLTENELT